MSWGGRIADRPANKFTATGKVNNAQERCVGNHNDSPHRGHTLRTNVTLLCAELCTSTVPKTVGHTEGFYTAGRNGLRYLYRASWTIVLDMLIWNGTVQTSDGEFAGTPSGLILAHEDLETDLEQAVKEQIEAAIERRPARSLL
jgi:hypothetical protein